MVEDLGFRVARLLILLTDKKRGFWSNTVPLGSLLYYDMPKALILMTKSPIPEV